VFDGIFSIVSFGIRYVQVNFKLLILRVLKILERGLANQKFEVYPVTGDSKVKAVAARVVTAIFMSWCTNGALARKKWQQLSLPQ